MKLANLSSALLAGAAVVAMVVATPSEAKPGGNGGGPGGGGGGGKNPPGVFEPEFAGIRIGGRNKPDQLVLKNRDSSTEVVIYQAVGLRGVDLSIDSEGLIGFLLNDTIYLQSWSADETFGVSNPVPVHSNAGGLGPPDFSPDGSRIAFLEADDNGAAALNICNIDPNPLRCESFLPQSALLGWQLNLVRFHPEDKNKVVLSGRPPGVLTDGVYIHTIGNTAAPGPAITQAVGDFDDVGPASGSNPPLLVASDNGQAQFYSLDDGSNVSVTFNGFGYGYRFNCSSDALLYLDTGGGGPFIAVTEFGGPVEKLSNKGWNINRGHDWMPKAGCP